MSQNNPPVDTPLAPAPSTRNAIRLRLWPGVLVVVVYAAVSTGFSLFASINIQSFIALVIVPLSAALLLSVWWLGFSRVPVRDRLLGFALVVVSLALSVIAQESNRVFILAYAIPAAMIGVVGTLVLTAWLDWNSRRWVAAAYVVLCAGVCAALRVDTIGGDLAPMVSWRWSPTLAERSQSLPAAQAHGTAALPAQTEPGDWPAFRGAERAGHAAGKFAMDWTTPPREVWRRRIGPAWSSFAVVGDYLFTQEQRGDEELVTCYQASTGDEVWANSVHARYDDTMGLGPRATPTYDEGRLFTQGATGIVQCLDAATGSRIWTRELTKDSETDVPMYGFASSPLLAGGHVITYAGRKDGKAVAAYARATGEIVWQAGRGSGGYSSPHLAQLGGTPQVLMVSDSGLQSFAPDTGALLWENVWEVKTNPRCVQPLIVDTERVMYGATGAYGSRLVRVRAEEGAWQTEEVWSSKSFRPYFNDCVSYKGYCYGFDGERLVCIDLATGKRRWQGKRMGGQLLLLPEMGKLLILSEDGEVVLVDAIPERYTEASQFKALSGKTWNHPVVARGHLFVRNSEEAACYALQPAE